MVGLLPSFDTPPALRSNPLNLLRRSALYDSEKVNKGPETGMVCWPASDFGCILKIQKVPEGLALQATHKSRILRKPHLFEHIH